MTKYRALASLAAVGILGGATGSALAAAPAQNILFYGNSFTANLNLPWMFANIAGGLGQTRPNAVNAAVGSEDLAFHIAVQNSNVAISPNTSVKHWIDDNSLNNNSSGKWNYVVLQEYSTKPTNITYPNGNTGLPYGIPAGSPLGNGPAFISDASTLYNMVKTNSPTVTPILFESWTRQPGNTADLGHFYPALTAPGTPAAYLNAANQMQSELHQYFDQARTVLGGDTVAGLADVGDAFQTLGYETKLYGGDLYHEGYLGQIMACLVLYDTIYNDNVSRFTFDYVDGHIGYDNLTRNGLTSAEWPAFAAAADAAAHPVLVPEPAGLGLLAAGAMMLLRRRSRAK